MLQVEHEPDDGKGETLDVEDHNIIDWKIWIPIKVGAGKN